MTFKVTAVHNDRTYQATRLSLRTPHLPSSGEIMNRCDDRRGSQEGVYEMKKWSELRNRPKTDVCLYELF
jgi:hypothetical protein